MKKNKFLRLFLALFLTLQLLPTRLVEMHAEEATTSKTASLLTDLSSLASGDKVVIYNPASGLALDVNKAGTNNNYRAATSVSVTDNKMSDVTDNLLWEVGTNTIEGQQAYTFTCGEDANGIRILNLVSNSGNLKIEIKTDNLAIPTKTSWFLEEAEGGVRIRHSEYLGKTNETPLYIAKSEYNGAAQFASAELTDANAANLTMQLFVLDETTEEPTETGPKEGLITDLKTIEDGDTIVIYNENQAKAMSSVDEATYYRAATDVIIEDNKVTNATADVIWTVGLSKETLEDGTTGPTVVTLTDKDGRKLSAGSRNSLPMDDENDIWTFIGASTPDHFYLANVNRENQYAEIYNGRFTAYQYKEDNEAIHAMRLYHAIETEEPEPEPEPEPVASEPILEDGKQYVIYNPAHLKAMSQNKTGNYNLGQDITVDGETISGYEDTEIYTVKVTEVENGYTYAFTGADGKNIAMNEDKSYIVEGEANDQWLIEAQEDGTYLIKNAARNTYLEWYSRYSNWSTYSNTSDIALFAQKFYLVPTPVEDGLVRDINDLQNGDTVVIVNKANNMALSQDYNGNYNSGVTVTINENKVVDPTNEIIWTVGITENNGVKEYTFASKDGKKLSMGEQYSSMPLDNINQTWSISAAPTIAESYFVKNNGRSGYTMEWFADRNYWSAYHNTSDEALFAQQFYRATRPEESDEGPLADGSRVVIYNVAAESVFGPSDGTSSFEIVSATITDNVAECENGALIFTVHKEGDVYYFEHNGKYLAMNNVNDAEDLILSDSKEDVVEHRTRWTLTPRNDKYIIYSENATYKGSKTCIEFFSGHMSGWTFSANNDINIYLFDFYPLKEGTKEYQDMVNTPKVIFFGEDTVILNDEYKGSFTLDDLAKDQTEVKAYYEKDSVKTDIELETENNTDYTFTLPKEASATLSDIVITVDVTKPEDGSYSGSKAVKVIDEILFNNPKPEPNSETGSNLCPEISVEVTNAGEGYTAELKIGKDTYTPTINGNVISYTPEEDLKKGRTSVSITVKRADGAEKSKSWSFTVGEATEGLYFGQLHAHTQYSDGSGSLESALEYIDALPESANVQFVAFTDHSNYFDTTSAANPEQALYDMSLASEYSQETWNRYRSTIESFNEKGGSVLALPGFEMTWSGGPGHINTWNTPGIVSRNNTTLNNKTSDAGMKAYYALLSQNEGVDSISQFNHPGSTFGTFSDFAYWDAVIDSRMYLVEVGNGEGQIGQGGYYPSYEYYTMALDKGWHVAPTNNQDNHKGRWGNANDARDVILTDNFSEQGIYDAIRKHRVYATEDKNLEIYYTVNDLPLGTIISEVPESLDVKVQVADPDSADKITKVELVVNSGVVAHTWDNEAEIAAGELTAALSPDYSYYYVRVTQSDGDKAVTAPVWVGETLKLGISNVSSSTMMPVTGEELTLTTGVFNSESIPAKVKSITYTTDGSKVIGVDTEEKDLPASSTLDIPYPYTPTEARVMKITATVVLEQEGKTFTYTKDIELDVSDSSKLVYIGIDASHQNEYVAGNYKDSMGNFAGLASEHGVRTVILNTKEELLAACTDEKFIGLIFTAPSRRNGNSLREPYNNYEEDELAAIKNFNDNGGLVVVANWSDFYEGYGTFPADKPEDQMAAQQNKLLEALGSSLRVSDDATYDDELNGGQAYRLYFDTYNLEHPLLEGVEYDAEHPHDRLYTEVFSQYGGSTIYAVDDSGNPTDTLKDTIHPAVYGHSGTYSVDSDKDGFGAGDSVPKYALPNNPEDKRLLVTASEEMEGKGRIVVSGAAFMSNFEVQKAGDSGASDTDQIKNYANYKFCENLLKDFNTVEISKVEEVRAQTDPGYKFTIEVVVTSNASGYDKDTAFFDCIYGQDETGGINLFPVAGDFKIGDKVRVTGKTEFYQGEPELQVSSIVKIGENEEVTPKEVSAKEITSREVEGLLITLKGTVTEFEYENGLIQTIMVKDANGDEARVFIDGYITTSQDVENCKVGNEITVTGLASYDDTFKAPEGPFPRIRIRDRKDVVITDQTGVSGISLDKTRLTMYQKKTAKLNATIEPSTAYNKNVKWSSDNEAVATVDELGNIISIAPGKATITATSVDGGHTATCDITVQSTIVIITPKYPYVSTETVGIFNKNTKVTSRAIPSQKITFTSDNPNIAKVDNQGNITGVSDPNVLPTKIWITATSEDGISDSVLLTVEDPINAFVRRLYRECLGRNPEKGGFEYWTNLLRTKKLSASQVAYGFMESKEFIGLGKTNTDFVNTLYKAMLDRKPDGAGNRFWLTKIANGETRQSVEKGFVNSVEFDVFAQRYGLRGSKVN